MARVDMDLSHDKTQDDFTPVPPGEYDLKVMDSAVIESKSGLYLIAKLEYQVVSPPEYRGRKVWDQLNIKGLSSAANEDAVRIGREKLKTLATIGGHKNPNFIRDTEELHGMVVGAKIEVDGDYNRVKVYKKPQNGNGKAFTTKSTVPPEVAAQAQQVTQAKFPWQKA